LAPIISPYLGFLNSLSRMIISGDVVFVHAAVDRALPLEDQPDSAVYWGQTPSGGSSSAQDYRVVHGHFANFEPVSRPDRICVDTGAYYSGRLTAVRLDEDERFLHVDTADLFAPAQPQTRS
jgi:serine/threonine protein phosphatase 1